MKSSEHIVETHGFEWKSFIESFEESDILTALINRAKKFTYACSKIENNNVFESIVMSILVEHQREISQLIDQLLTIKTKTCPRCKGKGPIEDFYKLDSKDDSVSILCQYCQEALFFNRLKN